MEENIILSEQRCDALPIQLFNKAVQPKLSDDGMGYTSVEEVRSDFADIRDVFLSHVKGPAKWSKLALFTETKLCETMNVLQGRLKAAYERKMRSLEESMNSVVEDLERERGATGGYKSELEETVQKIAAVQAYEVELERRVREKSKSIEE